jgi:hypothetical protein
MSLISWSLELKGSSGFPQDALAVWIPLIPKKRIVE